MSEERETLNPWSGRAGDSHVNRLGTGIGLASRHNCRAS